MVSNFPCPDGKAVPFHLSLFNFNSSGKKLWCWYLSTLFNLLGCQANEIAGSMLYTKCFYVASEAKRLFSSLEAHRPSLWLSWLIWWIHILCTLKGNSHSLLQWCNIETAFICHIDLESLCFHGAMASSLCPSDMVQVWVLELASQKIMGKTANEPPLPGLRTENLVH